MSRRNRRHPSTPCRSIKYLNADQAEEVREFAREHLKTHTAALDRAAADELPMTYSQHPTHGFAFLSAGQRPDEAAIALTRPAVASDDAARVAG
jgi:hypothetical protein